MRKIFSTMMLVAAAAMTFVSCQKEIAPTQVEDGYISFTSANPETKTAWNGETIVWSVGDNIRVACQNNGTWYTSGSTPKAKLYASIALSSDALEQGAESVQFKVKTGDGSFPTDLEGELQFYALYPSGVADASFDQDTSCESVKIATEQKVSSSTYDSSCDIMWGKATTTCESIPTDPLAIVWNRVVAHANITLNKIPDIVAGEKINTIKLTAQENAALAGTFDLNMATGEFSAYSASNTITLTCDNIIADASGNVEFWACINPCTITSLDIEVETDAATYTVSKTGFSREFLANHRNVLPINMSDAERLEKVVSSATYHKVTSTPADWCGRYLLVAEKNNNSYVFNQTIESDWGRITSVTIEGGAISTESPYEITIETGTVAGTYAIRLANGSYLSASAKNKLNTSASKISNTDMVLTLQTDGTVKIALKGKETRTLQCNASTSYGFRFYDSGSMIVPQLYKLQD